MEEPTNRKSFTYVSLGKIVGSPVAASAKLVLRLDKQGRDGACPVYLRVIKNRKVRYITTGVRVPPTEWNENKEQVRAGNDIADSHNHKLSSIKNDALSALNDGRNARQVKARLAGETGEVGSYLAHYVDRLKGRGQFWEEKKFGVLKTKLERCFPGGLKWSECDVEAINFFRNHLVTECSNAPNTVRKELDRLKRVFVEAMREDVLDPSANPFIKYRMPKGTVVARRKLDANEITAIRTVEVTGKQAVTRDVFLFSFFAGGMRFGDLCKLRVRDISDGRISYTAMKTGRPMSLAIPRPGVEIAESYARGKDAGEALFPLLEGKKTNTETALRASISSANAAANTSLKKVAGAAGLDPEGLSMHIARHSFADLARRKSGNLHAIMQALGHSDLKVTQTYLKSLDEDEKDELVKDVWEGL
jgi:integrase